MKAKPVELKISKEGKRTKKINLSSLNDTVDKKMNTFKEFDSRITNNQAGKSCCSSPKQFGYSVLSNDTASIRMNQDSQIQNVEFQNYQSMKYQKFVKQLKKKKIGGSFSYYNIENK